MSSQRVLMSSEANALRHFPQHIHNVAQWCVWTPGETTTSVHVPDVKTCSSGGSPPDPEMRENCFFFLDSHTQFSTILSHLAG